MAIVPANCMHCSYIARLHAEGISTGFLPRLGIKFLTQLYSAMVASEYGVLLVSVDENREANGFVSGSRSVKSFYLDFLFSVYGFKSAIEIGNLLFKRKGSDTHYGLVPMRSLLTKSKETLLYPFKGVVDPLPKAELISIVVAEEERNRGVAKDLFEGLKAEFLRQGIGQFKVYVSVENKRACDFYEKVGGRFTRQIEVHKGEVSNVYIFNTDSKRI